MNISINEAFFQVVEQENIDLNSRFGAERRLCISRMFDLFDMSNMNVYESKLFVETVEDFVNKEFDSFQELDKLFGGFFSEMNK